VTEPISVRVARLRGCEPVPPSEAISWWTCRCSVCHTGSNYSRIDWLQPAAWALLLSEMVEANRRPEIWISTNPATPKYAVGESHFNGIETGRGDTIGEAVALAWINWRESCVVK